MKNILTVDVEELHHRLAYSDECKKKGLTFHGSALLGTIKIIKLLKRYRQTATFFIIGEILEKYPDIGNLIIHQERVKGQSQFIMYQYTQKIEIEETVLGGA